MTNLPEIVSQLKAGRFSFQAEGDPVPAWAEFQCIVRVIHELKDKGLLTITKEHRESQSGEKYVDLVRVEMTYNGEDWLTNF